MSLVFNFCLESGEKHPKERELQQSAIAREILALISKNEEVWCNPEITYQFPVDGTDAEDLGCLSLSGITLSSWFYVYELKISPAAFERSVLSGELKKQVESFLRECTEELRVDYEDAKKNGPIVILDWKIVQQWMLDFPSGKMFSIARDLHVPESVAEKFDQLYNDVCNDWLKFNHVDSAGLEEIKNKNRIEEKFAEIFSNYETCVKSGHSAEFSFFYARSRYQGDDAPCAEEKAYLLMGNEVQKERELLGRAI